MICRVNFVVFTDWDQKTVKIVIVQFINSPVCEPVIKKFDSIAAPAPPSQHIRQKGHS